MNEVTVITLGVPVVFRCHNFSVQSDDGLRLVGEQDEDLAYFPSGAWQGVWRTDIQDGPDKTIFPERKEA